MRMWLLSLAFLAAAAVPGWGQTPEEMIIASLEEQGYHVVLRDRTWLGRIWLLVENDEVRREIVFNPGTGEIMRDYAVMIAAAEPDSKKSSKDSGSTLATAAPTSGLIKSTDPLAATAIEGALQTLTGPALILPPESP